MLSQAVLPSLALLALLPTLPVDDRADDHTEIERAALDYAEAYYEVREDYVERSIHPDLAKVGYERQEDGSYLRRPMNYEAFHRMVRWLEDNRKKPEAGPKVVEVLDAMDRTAVVRLTAAWGVDYLQLGKFDDKWMIRHVLWQSEPPYLDEERRLELSDAVKKAAENYLEAIYRAKPDWLSRSVAPSLVKYGLPREGDSTGSKTTYAQLAEEAGTRYAKKPAPEDALRTVEILDLMDRTACVKLTADWGVEYLNLAEIDGHWMILQVMGQSPPQEDSDS